MLSAIATIYQKKFMLHLILGLCEKRKDENYLNGSTSQLKNYIRWGVNLYNPHGIVIK